MKSHTLITENVYSFDTEYQGLLFNPEERNLIIYGAARAGGTSISSMWNPLGLVVTSRNKLILRTKIKKGYGKGKTRVTVVNLK